MFKLSLTVFAITTANAALINQSFTSKDNQVEDASNFNGFSPWDVSVIATTNFPEWLQVITGLSEWPGADPPYIPLEFIDFSIVPNYAPREPGECPINRELCSYDCYKCFAYDDICTCEKLSQSFDDGPSIHTLTLLDRLESKSTFFTLGVNVVRHPEIYHRIMEEGHLIGSHTWSHKFLPSLSNEEIVAQFQWSIWAMNATGNHLPKWYRPPYGAIDDRVRSIARQFNMQAVLWSHDTFDWQIASNLHDRSKQDVLNDVFNWKGSEVGGIVLEHDVYESTVDAAMGVHEIIGQDQWTMAQCAYGPDYVEEF